MKSYTSEDINQKVLQLVDKIILLSRQKSAGIETEVTDVFAESKPQAPYTVGKYSISINNRKYTLIGQRSNKTFFLSELEVLNDNGNFESFLNQDLQQGKGYEHLLELEEVLKGVGVPSTPQPGSNDETNY